MSTSSTDKSQRESTPPESRSAPAKAGKAPLGAEQAIKYANPQPIKELLVVRQQLVANHICQSESDLMINIGQYTKFLPENQIL